MNLPDHRCEHLNFAAQVDVNRLTETIGGPVTRYLADVRIKCADCGLPFEFQGLKLGIDTGGCTMSLDGQEAHLAILPNGKVASPLGRIAAHFKSEILQ